jgi:ferredoxin
MAKKINEECIVCGACEPECPNDAISNAGSIFVIDPAKCTECVGAFEAPRCIEVCPIDSCIVPDPSWLETPEQLQAKYARLHG